MTARAVTSEEYAEQIVAELWAAPRESMPWVFVMMRCRDGWEAALRRRDWGAVEVFTFAASLAYTLAGCPGAPK